MIYTLTALTLSANGGGYIATFNFDDGAGNTGSLASPCSTVLRTTADGQQALAVEISGSMQPVIVPTELLATVRAGLMASAKEVPTQSTVPSQSAGDAPDSGPPIYVPGN